MPKAFSKNSFFNEYCLILNNDIKLCEGALGQLIDFAKNNPHSIITAPKVFDFSAFLISKDIYHEVGPFDENLKGGSLRRLGLYSKDRRKRNIYSSMSNVPSLSCR